MKLKLACGLALLSIYSGAATAQDCAQEVQAHGYLLRAQSVCAMKKHNATLFRRVQSCRGQMGLDNFIESTRQGLAAADTDAGKTGSKPWCETVAANFDRLFGPQEVAPQTPVTVASLPTSDNTRSVTIANPTATVGQVQDGCRRGVVRKLDPAGDGFLALRKGPATSFPMLDKLVNADELHICAQRGVWLKVYRGSEGCRPGATRQAEGGPCVSGWVHRGWVSR